MMNDYELNEIFLKAKKVYNSLMDEMSKKIFSLRTLYNLTGDYNYLVDMTSLIPEFDINETYELRKFYNKLKKIKEENKSSKLIIYGAGRQGNYLFDLFKNIDWYCFCDKDTNKQNNNFCGLRVISPKQLISEHKEDFVIIGTRDYSIEVYNELISKGFPANHIINDKLNFDLKILFEKQYFEDSIILPQKNEVFVDAGCFNCDTSVEFKKWCNEDYKKIYAFEPDYLNYLKCKDTIKEQKIDKIELFNLGLWSEKNTLRFKNEGNSSSSILENGYENVDVISLDEIVLDEKVSFIKMDIEGAELEGLKGARDTIIKNRPRLAICIYHKPEDILEIPLYLQSIVPDYKFYIRHYSNHDIETVLYAV